MPKYSFQCLNDACEHCFELHLSISEYNPVTPCPLCTQESKRIYTPVSVHQGRTLGQKTTGTSKRTIDHGKYMREAREKRKQTYNPNSREAQSNELWTGNEVQDGVINAPKKNKGTDAS